MAFYRYTGKRQVYEVSRRDATSFPLPSMQWMDVNEPDIIRFLESMIANGSPRFEKQSEQPEVVTEVKRRRSTKKKPEEIQLEAVPEVEAVAEPVAVSVVEPVDVPASVEEKVEAEVKPEPAKVEDDDPLGGI